MTDAPTEDSFDGHYNRALEIYLKTGSVDEVQKYADQIVDEDYRWATLAKVASFIAAAAVIAGEVREEQFRQALAMCASISHNIERSDAFSAIGNSLSRRSYTEPWLEPLSKQVLELGVEAARLEQRSPADAIIFGASVELSKLGYQLEADSLMREAIELAQGSMDFESSKTLKGACLVLARWDRMAEAVRIAQTIKSPEMRALTLKQLDRWPPKKSIT